MDLLVANVLNSDHNIYTDSNKIRLVLHRCACLHLRVQVYFRKVFFFSSLFFYAMCYTRNIQSLHFTINHCLEILNHCKTEK